MKTGLAVRSLFLLALSVVFLVILTMFESALVGISTQAERAITFLLLVVPASVGAVLGILSLARWEGQAWLATLTIVSNTLFALFHSMLIIFAG